MWPAPAPAKFEYSSLIGQGLNHQSLLLVTSHVRSALCTLMKQSKAVEIMQKNFITLIKKKSLLLLIALPRFYISTFPLLWTKK